MARSSILRSPEALIAVDWPSIAPKLARASRSFPIAAYVAMEADERVPFLGKKKKKEKEREKESKERGKDREKDKHRDSASERTDDDDEPDRPYKEKDKKDRATRAGLLSESSTEEEQTLGTSSAIPSLASFPSYPSSLLTLSSSLSRSSSSYSFDEAGLNLVNLPSEIIYRIFASLSPKDLLALQLSCAAFRVIVQEDYTWKRRLHDPLVRRGTFYKLYPIYSLFFTLDWSVCGLSREADA